ncbi:MAG: SPOR domain-containing protein [Candidatus Methylomirabilia bacterium]
MSPARSIFQESWFRLLLGGIAFLVVAVLALPYLLDWWFPAPPPPPPLMTAPAPTVKPPAAPPPVPPALSQGPALPKPTAPPAGLPSRRRAEEPRPTPAAPAPKPERAPPPPPVTAKAPQARPKAPPLPKPQVREPRAPREARATLEKGTYWVQVGAFKNPAYAEQLAAKLSAARFPVGRATRSRPLERGHEVVVVGASKRDVDGKLLGRPYQTEAGSDGVVIRSLPSLKEAVAIARELSGEGFTVRIRRSRGSVTLHVVRAGAYPSRKRAEAALAELAKKGFAGFVMKEAGE